MHDGHETSLRPHPDTDAPTTYRAAHVVHVAPAGGEEPAGRSPVSRKRGVWAGRFKGKGSAYFLAFMDRFSARDAGKRREKVRATRLTVEEADQLDRAASQRGMNVAQYLRACAQFAIRHDAEV